MSRAREARAATAIAQEFASCSLAELNRRWQAAVRQDAFLAGTEPRSEKHREARILKQALNVALYLRSGDSPQTVFVPTFALNHYAPERPGAQR
jgi:hypothetical protein